MSKRQQVKEGISSVYQQLDLKQLWFSILVAVLVLIIMIAVASGSETAVDFIKAIGGLGTFAAAGAVVWGFRYTRRTVRAASKQVKNQTTQLKQDAQARAEDEFFRACSELSSEGEHARISALYHLGELVRKDPYKAKKTLAVVTAFMRTRSSQIAKDEEWVLNTEVVEDVSVAFVILKELIKIDMQYPVSGYGDFRGNLSNCNFAGLTLVAIDLGEWNLRNAKFVRCGIYDSNLAYCDLSGARFIESYIEDCGFQHSDMSGTSFDQTSLDFSHYRDGFPFEGVDVRSVLDDNLALALGQVQHNCNNGLRTSYDWDIAST